MESVIEPVLDSVAGNIEIAIYTAPEIEDPLTTFIKTMKSVSIRN